MNKQDQHKQGALHPDIFADFHALESMKEEKEAERRGLDVETTSLAYLSRTKGWTVLKDFMESMIKDLDNMVTACMQQGMSFEEIGKRSLLSTLTKEALLKIITKVNDCREEADKARG